MANMASKLRTLLSFQRSSSLFYSSYCSISLSIFLISALIVIIFLSSFDFFYCCDKHMIKINLKRAVLTSSYSLLSIMRKSQGECSRPQPGGKSWDRNPRGTQLTGLFAKACCVGFLVQCRTTWPGICPPTQIINKENVPTDLPTS